MDPYQAKLAALAAAKKASAGQSAAPLAVSSPVAPKNVSAPQSVAPSTPGSGVAVGKGVLSPPVPATRTGLSLDRAPPAVKSFTAPVT